MFNLPGRDVDPEQMEANRALSVLKEAEEIKDQDGGFLKLVAAEVEKEQGILERIANLVCNMTETDAEEMMDPEDHEAPQSKRVEDFFARLRQAANKEEFRTDESPIARRRRIESGSGKTKTMGNRVLVKFT